MKNLKQHLIALLVVTAVGGVTILWGSYHLARASPQSQSLVVISDATFDPSDWIVYVTNLGNSDAASVTIQQVAGGFSGAYRSTTDTFPAFAGPGYQGLYTLHLFQETYDPASQGPIGWIDYQEDHSLLGFSPVHSSAYMRGAMILVQDNVIYTASSTTHNIERSTWQTYSQTGLQASSFAPLFGSETQSQPDFSAQGSPITFGYVRSRLRNEADPPEVPLNQNLVYQHGIDNWQVGIWFASGNRPPVAGDDEEVLDPPIHSVFIDLFENDQDADNDPLTLHSVTNSTYGRVVTGGTPGKPGLIQWVKTDDSNFAVDNFSYTATDGQLISNSANVWVYVDCGCSLKCLSYLTDTSASASLASTAATADTLDLALIYRVRDQVMKPTPHGNRYINMYYQTTPEILRILLRTQPNLGAEAVSVVELWQDNLTSLVDGDGSAVVTQAQVDAIETFLANLSAAGSAELQQLIAAELTRLGPLDDYVGLTVKEAKRQAIGDALIYLPLIIK